MHIRSNTIFNIVSVALVMLLILSGCSALPEAEPTPSKTFDSDKESTETIKIGYCVVLDLFIEDLCNELELESVMYEEATLDEVYEGVLNGTYDIGFAPRYEGYETLVVSKFAMNATLFRAGDGLYIKPDKQVYTLNELKALFLNNEDVIGVIPVSFYSQAYESFLVYQLCGDAKTTFGDAVYDKNDFSEVPEEFVTSAEAAIGEGFYLGMLEGKKFLWPIEFVEYAYGDNRGSGKNAIPVSIDGVAPTIESVLNGEYPLSYDLCVITRSNSNANDPESLISEFLLSSNGQSFLTRRTMVLNLLGGYPSI